MSSPGAINRKACLPRSTRTCNRCVLFASLNMH